LKCLLGFDIIYIQAERITLRNKNPSLTKVQAPLGSGWSKNHTIGWESYTARLGAGVTTMRALGTRNETPAPERHYIISRW
jgi:hypothetical protein